MNFIIAQIISIIALIISIVIVQFKDVKHILLGEIASNLTIALSFAFLGGLSGAWICIVASIQTLIIYFANKHNVEPKKKDILTISFAVVYIIGTIIVYQNWGDIVSCACSLLYIMAIIQTKPQKYRFYMSANSILWIIYDILTAAYVNIITHGLLLISLFIAMFLAQKKEQN